MTDECVTCGHPALRPEGHAEWCEMVAARNRLALERIATETNGNFGVPWLAPATSAVSGSPEAPFTALVGEAGVVGSPARTAQATGARAAGLSLSAKANGPAVNEAACETTTHS